MQDERLPRAPIRLPGELIDWLTRPFLRFMRIEAGAGAMLMQTWAQAHLPAARAAIVMTTEPVFAAGFAVALGVDALTWRMLAGGALVLGAMYLVELMPRPGAAPEAESLHHEV